MSAGTIVRSVEALSEDVEKANRAGKYFAHIRKEGQADTASDALRHLLIAGRLRQRFGRTAADVGLKAHEAFLPDGRASQRMDAHNNDLGLTMGGETRNGSQLYRLARKAIADQEQHPSSSGPRWLKKGEYNAY